MRFGPKPAVSAAAAAEAKTAGLKEDLLGTHSALTAAQGAIFHVPPPLHIKFMTPSSVQPTKFQASAVQEFKDEITKSMEN